MNTLSLIFRGMIVFSVTLLVVGIVKPEWIRFPANTTWPYNDRCCGNRRTGDGFLAQVRFNMLERMMLKPLIVTKSLVRLCMSSTRIRFAATQE